jgi:hypothetical protein
VWHAETPILRTAPAPMFLLAKCVRDAGFKVVLTGEGADELFAGYDIFREDKVRRFWARDPESELRPRLLARLNAFLQEAVTGMLMVQLFRRQEVDRAARGSIHADVNRQGKALIQKGRSLIIYAEGTRSRDGALRPFKKGAFTMALTSHLPVLPVSIHGSYEAWPPGQPWVHGGKIRVVIDPAIETADMTQADGNQLRDQVRDVIAGRVSEMGGKVGSV